MIHKINILDSRQGILTFSKKGEVSEATMILPNRIKLETGDAIAHLQHFKQVENKARLLRVEEIKEERPSVGEWNGEPPTFRRVIFKDQLYTKEELKDVVRIVEETDDKKNKVERFLL